LGTRVCGQWTEARDAHGEPFETEVVWTAEEAALVRAILKHLLDERRISPAAFRPRLGVQQSVAIDLLTRLGFR
jgi:hypothetical protein